ncbi:ceramidase domain-containing protein [Phycicoccus flavus]|uniref:Ceramidase n=1 Tax=Phycicoccus flavus TaxID=2502783 RepID=A0A8T6QYU0_9MICO|nr:ceramidase domain-containing protein [Phycicoccus flavus]NHA66676.1 ceramidase [Phycicoccus flavus]
MRETGRDPRAPRDLRPVAVASLVALVSVGLTSAAARYGWLGPDVGRGDGFCEAVHPGWVRQPANTWSNLGFVLAGLAVAVRASRPARLGHTLGRHPALATAFAVLVVLLGPGSMAMHATQSEVGGHLDLLSMFLLSGFAVAHAVMRVTRRGPGTLAVGFVLAVGAGMAVYLTGGRVPLLGHVGNAVFAVELWLAIGLEVLLVVRGRRPGEPRQDTAFGLASVGVLALAFAIWTTGKGGHPWCDPSALLQQHAVWHVLDALAAYLLFRHWTAERAPDRADVSAGRPGRRPRPPARPRVRSSR